MSGSKTLDQLCINTIRTLSMDAVQAPDRGQGGGRRLRDTGPAGGRRSRISSGFVSSTVSAPVILNTAGPPV